MRLIMNVSTSRIGTLWSFLRWWVPRLGKSHAKRMAGS